MRAVTQMGKETAMTTAGREMKIRQLSVSRPICCICYIYICMPGPYAVYVTYACLSLELNAY